MSVCTSALERAVPSFLCPHYLMLPHGFLGFCLQKACAIPFDVMFFVPVLLLRSHCCSLAIPRTKQRKNFLMVWTRATVKKSMRTVSAGTPGRAVLHASMWGVQELGVSTAALLSYIHAVISGCTEPKSDVTARRNCMGSFWEKARAHHCPSPELTHLLSVQDCQLCSLPCFYDPNWWAKARIQGFGVAGKFCPLQHLFTLFPL